VASDTVSFATLVEERLAAPEISEADMAGRRMKFKKYVSDPEGGALDLYIELLQEHVDQARSFQIQNAAAKSAERAVGQSASVENR